MNAHSHVFTEPYWPASFEADALAIDAQHQRDSELREWARRIVDAGPRDALKVCLRNAEVAEWARCAERYLDADGDDGGDFEGMFDGLDRWVNPVGYGPPDEDAGWRMSHAAETHFGGRFGI